MRLEGLVAGLLLLACGGNSNSSLYEAGTPGGQGGKSGSGSGAGAAGGSDGGTGGGFGDGFAASGGDSPSHPSGGSGGVAGAGGEQGSKGGASGHSGAAAGSSNGGSSGAAAGDGGASGAVGEGGEGGSSEPAPDDTGCIERPWSGNPGNVDEKLPVLDCSSCSNGDELGYTHPAFCGSHGACSVVMDITDLPKDGFVQLPPQREQTDFCAPQACKGVGGDPQNYPGYVMQLAVSVAGQNVRIETDPQRGILRRGQPLFACEAVRNCYRFQGTGQFAIVAAQGAQRGWVRISVDSSAAGTVCP